MSKQLQRRTPLAVRPSEQEDRAVATAPPDGDYLSGRSFITQLATLAGDDDRTELQRELVGPVLEALLLEYAPVTATVRMIAEMAANAYADHAMFSSLARRLIGDPASTAALERNSKLAAESMRRALECIDMLRRPNARAMRISIAAANNVNLGDQSVTNGVTTRRSRAAARG